MRNVQVHRYANPQAVGYAGWIEDASKSWILFLGLDGKPAFFERRDPTGAVLTG